MLGFLQKHYWEILIDTADVLPNILFWGAMLSLAVLASYVSWKIFSRRRHEEGQRDSSVALFTLELLRFIERNARPSAVTNVLLRNDGSLSYATLYGANFACNCSWPTVDMPKEPFTDEPRVLRVLQGKIMLKDQEILRVHLPLLGENLAPAFVLNFQIESDSFGDQNVRMKHGSLVQLELLDASESRTIYSQKVLILKHNSYTKDHDHVLEQIFRSLRGSVECDT